MADLSIRCLGDGLSQSVVSIPGGIWPQGSGFVPAESLHSQYAQCHRGHAAAAAGVVLLRSSGVATATEAATLPSGQGVCRTSHASSTP